MSRGGPATVVVAELVSSGRGAAAQPAFEPGSPIALAKGARGGASVGDLVTVSLRGRAGRVVAVHGPASSPRAALRALLASEDMGRPFPRAAIEEADALDEGSVAADPGRRDLRGQRVVTIDPEGAKDHDDALAVAQEGEGAWRLWVHIADVARFVAAGGAIDREAARRGTSVYVPGAVDPMLPARLSSDLCSLRPGADRAAISAEMVVDRDGNVGETRFSRSLIRSERRLTYGEVDTALEGGSLGDDALLRDVTELAGLARALRGRRMGRGALEASSAEPVVRFEGDRVAGIHMEGQTPAHSLVEECMIAANEAVARHLIARSRPTVFRHHEDPAQSRVAMVYEQLAELGVATPPLPEGEMGGPARRSAAAAAAEAVARHLAAAGGRGAEALWPLVLRSLRQAHYSATDVGHSGLASAAYLHFTSPIRRYPDLLVHRGLVDALGIGPAGPDRDELELAGVASSEAERAAAGVERRADRVCGALLLGETLHRDGWESVFPGEVTGLVPGGAFVAFGVACDGFLPARRIADEELTLDPLEVSLVGSRAGTGVRLGDTIEVRVTDMEPLRGRVTLEPAHTRTSPGVRSVRARRRSARSPR